MNRQILVRFYTKPGCPLCEDAESLLEVAGRRFPIAIQPVDIRRDPRLFALYGERIPVLEFPDGTLLEPPVTRDRLTAILRRMD